MGSCHGTRKKNREVRTKVEDQFNETHLNPLNTPLPIVPKSRKIRTDPGHPMAAYIFPRTLNN